MKISSISNQNSNAKRINFGSTGFKINNIDGLNCAYCGKKMISRRTLNEMFSDPEEELFIESARENIDYLRPFQQDIVNFLTQTQFYYKLPNDRYILTKASSLSRQELERDIGEKFLEMSEMVNKSDNKVLKRRLEKKGSNLYERLLRNKSYGMLRRVVEAPWGFDMRSYCATPLEKAIYAILDDCDKPEYSIFSYIDAKCGRGAPEPKDFFMELFLPNESTMEHIQPKSKSGSNSTKNYLAVCRTCNSDRGNTGFYNYWKKHPEIGPNIAQQLFALRRTLPRLISDNKIPREYEFYPTIAAKTLKRITHHELDIDV